MPPWELNSPESRSRGPRPFAAGGRTPGSCAGSPRSPALLLGEALATAMSHLSSRVWDKLFAAAGTEGSTRTGPAAAPPAAGPQVPMLPVGELVAEHAAVVPLSVGEVRQEHVGDKEPAEHGGPKRGQHRHPKAADAQLPGGGGRPSPRPGPPQRGVGPGGPKPSERTGTPRPCGPERRRLPKPTGPPAAPGRHMVFSHGGEEEGVQVPHRAGQGHRLGKGGELHRQQAPAHHHPHQKQQGPHPKELYQPAALLGQAQQADEGAGPHQGQQGGVKGDVHISRRWGRAPSWPAVPASSG